MNGVRDIFSLFFVNAYGRFSGVSRVRQVGRVPWAPLRGFSPQCSHMGKS